MGDDSLSTQRMNHLGGFGFGVSNTRSGTERSNQMRLQTTFTMHFPSYRVSSLQISSSTRVWDDFS